MDNAVDVKETVFQTMLDPQKSDSNSESTSEPSSPGLESLECLKVTFTPRPVSEKSLLARRKLGESKRRSQSSKALLSNVVAQNIAIVLKKIGLGIEELRGAVLRLDFDLSLTEGDLERLREVLPTAQEVQPLLAFKGDQAELRDIEQQVLRLVTIERVGPRLHCLALKKGLLERRQRLWEDITCIRSACAELMESPLLRDVLLAVLRMFNFINHGNESLEIGSARGFDITTASKIGDFRAAGESSDAETSLEKFTGLHFVVAQVRDKKTFPVGTRFLRAVSVAQEGGWLEHRKYYARNFRSHECS
jgi:hypothetical protein